MSLSVYIGHTGQRLSLEQPNVASDDKALRLWIAEHANIPRQDLILLTNRGRQVKAQNLLPDDDVYVFDAGRLNTTNPGDHTSSNPPPADLHPGTAPSAVANENDLQAWQNLFRLRKSWASGLLNGCETRARQAECWQDEQANIERCLAVAVASLQQHVKSAEQKYLAAEAWAEELLQDQDAHVANWEQHAEGLRAVPARADFKRFIQHATSTSRRTSLQEDTTTLQSFLDVPAVKKAAGQARSIMTGIATRVEGMRASLDDITKESSDLLQTVEAITDRSAAHSSQEPNQLYTEVELIVKKMSSDFEHVQSLSRNAQSIASASKLAQLAARNHIPALNELCTEMNDLVRRSKQQRDSAADNAMEHMRTLSRIETQLRELAEDAKSLTVSEKEQEVFNTLAIISRLPSVYGSLLVESVRRREWVAKMKRDSATLQEEVATYQEEEDKRRKKWVRSVEDVANVDALQTHVLGIELNLQNEGGSWPSVTRDELQEYLQTILRVYGPGEVTEEMDQAIKDLDKPTRKQIKHARAFKNGSMHEAAFGDTSLLLRGDEQHKVLRETNARLEEDLKAQKSRVRKLEDLLHRQSQSSRFSTGDVFFPSNTASPPTLHTPLPSSIENSRENSLKHRRLSSTAQALEEKKLARRVVDLEAELQAHRDEAASRKSSDAATQKQFEEAISTKKDLMENMEAQQREFASERRTLENELTEARERVEELENEIDRLMGSRDDERAGIDTRIASMQEEIARLKEDAMGHAARAATEQDARTALEKKLEVAERARAEAETQIIQMQMDQEKRQEEEAEQLQVLVAAHSQLAADVGDPPAGLTALSAAIEQLARRSAAHVEELKDAIALAKSENTSLWTSNERQKAELAKSNERQAQLEDHAHKIQDALSAERAKSHALDLQLRDEQEQLRLLREKFAEGETGSEVLRQRISEEETRAGKLSSELAEAKSHINSLDVELMRMQKKHKAYHTSAEAAAERLEKRADHARDLSQRLYALIARLSRLIEQFGLALSYTEDGAMIIERASKMAASTNMSDVASEIPRPGDLGRTVSLSSPPPTRKSSSADDFDPSLVHWVDAQSADDELRRFETFIQHVSRFNLDYFCEQVHKRLRDYEYTAKKYAKESKEATKRAEAYKERSVKLKAESHAKIAVRDFKEGDLALFLPTRGQAKGAWAAFNINCPHYFLAEREGMRLGTRDFIVARISKVEQKVVNLSRSVPSQATDDGSVPNDLAPSINDDDNPFDLSDGLTWWMVHATEERSTGSGGGAPSTPGLAKSTVAAANVDAKGSIRSKRNSKGEDASKVLNKSLDSRRSSSTSKRSAAGALMAAAVAHGGGSPTTGQHPDGLLAVRSRSESQASLRPPPTAHGGGVGGGGSGSGTNGLGVTADKATPPSTAASPHDAQPHGEQMTNRLPTPRPVSRDGVAVSPGKARALSRSKSPSKSVRSLQRHLEPKTPKQSPVKSPAKGRSGWESLWQAEFSLESPSKGGSK